MKIYSLLFSLLILSACGSATPHQASSQPTPLMVIAQGSQLNQVATQLSGSLTLFDAAGKKLKTLALNFSEDEDGNTIVTSPIFDLTKSTTYRFVIVFFWNGTPITYVDTTQATANDDNTTISFSESMLTYAQDTADANISANITAGSIPDLDSDDDGYSNFDEVRSGSDANDAQSVPAGPTIANAQATFNASGTLLTITADISDGNGITEASFSFTGADYLKSVVTETLSGASGDKTRSYKLEINPLYAPVGDLEIILRATNGKDRESGASLLATIPNSSSNIGPVIIFESVAAGQTISDVVTLSIRAFDRDGVQSTLLLLPQSINDTAQANDRFVGSWNTKPLGDGTYTLSVKATDTKGAFTEKSIAVKVSNGIDLSGPSFTIAVSEPNNGPAININGGATVYGTIDVLVNANDPNEPQLLRLINPSIEGLGQPTSSTPTLYRNTINTAAYNEGDNITLSFESTDKLGNRSTYDASMTVRNKPTLSSFTVNSALSATITQPGNVTFNWTAANATGITVKHVASAATFVQSTALTGPVAVSVNKSGTYRLTATRTTFTETRDVTVLIDGDGDGFGSAILGGTDCDDTKTSVNPNAAERLNGIDDNCDTSIDRVSLSQADLVFTGETAGDQAGFSLTGLGDVDGDGKADLLIGASQHSEGNLTERGSSYLIFGKDNLSGAHSLSEVQTGLGAKFLGVRANDRNGTRSFKAGDIDNNGLADFAIGNYAENGGEGAIYLFKGKARSNYNGLVALTSAFANFKGDVSGLGNALGISFATGLFNSGTSLDVMIGAARPGYGAVYLFNGPLLGGNYSLNKVGTIQPNVTIVQNETTGRDGFSYFGYSVANAGDTNQDGRDDLLMGSYGGDGGGKAYMLLGTSGASFGSPINSGGIATSIRGEHNWYDDAANDTFGSVVSSAGDVNGDGADDALMTAGQYDTNRGSVYLFYGPFSGQLNADDADAQFIGEATNDFFGGHITHGDVNNDGLSDIIIGAQGNDQGGNNAGAIYIFYGKDGDQELNGVFSGAEADAKIIGQSANSEVYMASFIGNFTGTSSPNGGLAISGRNESNFAGKVYIVNGQFP